MLKLTSSVCIDAPPAAVWAVLSDLEGIQRWVPIIRRSYCPEQNRGVGASRVCELKQGAVRETVLEWEEGRSFTYRGEGAPMMKSAINRWTVSAHGTQTLVTSAAEVELKGGIFGWMLEPLLKVVSLRLGASSLASLKYYVEHGEVYGGNIKELLPTPGAC
jgi:carbon monoxide dehydrogenase subunit G